jgi:hypothetical protein
MVVVLPWSQLCDPVHVGGTTFLPLCVALKQAPDLRPAFETYAADADAGDYGSPAVVLLFEEHRVASVLAAVDALAFATIAENATGGEPGANGTTFAPLLWRPSDGAFPGSPRPAYAGRFHDGAKQPLLDALARALASPDSARYTRALAMFRVADCENPDLPLELCETAYARAMAALFRMPDDHGDAEIFESRLRAVLAEAGAGDSIVEPFVATLRRRGKARTARRRGDVAARRTAYAIVVAHLLADGYLGSAPQERPIAADIDVVARELADAAPAARPNNVVVVSGRIAMLASIVALFAAIVTFTLQQAPTTSSRTAESAVPGRAAVLYPTARAARAECSRQNVVFADDDERVVYPQGDPSYGAWNDAEVPERGFGCAADLAANGFHASTR